MREYPDRIAIKTGCERSYVEAVLKDAGFMKRKRQEEEPIPLYVKPKVIEGEKLILVYPQLPGGFRGGEARRVEGVVEKIYEHHVILKCKSKDPDYFRRESVQWWDIWKYKKERNG